MSRRKSEQNESNVSFLDVIACAFGAIVLLVLILPIQDFGLLAEAPPVSENYDLLLMEDSDLEAAIEMLSTEIETNQAILDELGMAQTQSADTSATRSQTITATAAELEKVKADVAKTNASTLQIKSQTVQPTSFTQDEYAGIPVDSEYVIFVIDTSGSMQEIWYRVVEEVTGVLELYPKMKGFQILSDQGKYMYHGDKQGWLQDTPKQRNQVIQRLRRWRANSNSSPAEGIRTALRNLYDPDKKTALFIFGDDFATNDDLDEYIRDIEAIVSSTGVQEGTLRLHAFGFENEQYATMSPVRFAVLMRELTYRNGGAFLALPSREVAITRNE